MSLSVEFVGICTHIRNLQGANVHFPARHRVVLVNAQNGARINGNAIPPHIPKLIVDPDDIRRIDGFPYGLQETGIAGVWRLGGVHLAIEGTDDSYACLDSYAEVPRMASTTRGLSLSHEVVEHEDAACYFDIDAGRLESTKTEHHAISTRLTVETSDAPALRVTCFWNDKPSWIHLKPGAKITIEHTGHQHGDSDKDYLLHYRVFGPAVPEDAFVPKEPKQEMNKIPGSISVACSNSQYP